MLLMVVEISDFLSRVEASQYTIFTQKFHSSVHKTLKKFNGLIHKTDNNNYWVSFEGVNDAIQCALEIQHKFKYVTPKHKSFSRRLSMALTVADHPDPEAFDITKRLCEFISHQVAITSEVKALYASKNKHAEIDKSLIRVLKPGEEVFLNRLMTALDWEWANAGFGVTNLCKALDLSYSQLYGRLVKLTGMSPNAFIKDFRLHKALELLYYRKGTISNIAKATGFNSATYFSLCFLQKYGVRPSRYVQQHAV